MIRKGYGWYLQGINWGSELNMEWIAPTFWPYNTDDERRTWSCFLILAGLAPFLSTHNFHFFLDQFHLYIIFCKVAKIFLSSFRFSFFCTRDYRFFPPFSFFSRLGPDGWKKKKQRFPAFLFYVPQQSKCRRMKKGGKFGFDWASLPLGNDSAGFFSCWRRRGRRRPKKSRLEPFLVE